jgi:aerobic carbon-monoxide dehydrogenase large subunit
MNIDLAPKLAEIGMLARGRAMTVHHTGIGASVVRLEDPPLVTGRGQFVGDLSFPHQLHMRVVRSPCACGVIADVDAAEAKALPGVVAVWTAADIRDLPPIEFREGPNEKLAPFRQPVLARDRVRSVGEPVAAVFAVDPYVAEDAADLVVVTIDERSPLLDAAAEPGEFAEGLQTEATVCRQGYGDIDAAFADAWHVDRPPLRRPAGDPGRDRPLRRSARCAGAARRRQGAPPQPRIARPHVRPQHRVGALLRIPCRRRVRRPRGDLSRGYPGSRRSDAARPSGKMDRRPARASDVCQPFRQQRHKVRAAFDADGHLLAIDDRFFLDQGAYIRTHDARVADMTCGILPGPYRLPHFTSPDISG